MAGLNNTKHPKLPQYAAQVWFEFLLNIQPHVNDTGFIEALKTALPIPGYGPRQICRMREWLDGSRLPSAPIGLAIMAVASQRGLLTRQDIQNLLDMRVQIPNQTQQRQTDHT